MLPFALLRRLECALEPTRDAVCAAVTENEADWERESDYYCQYSSKAFYNVTAFRLNNLGAPYRQYKDDAEYVQHVSGDYDAHARVYDLLEMFPDFRMRVKRDRKTHKVEMGADIQSVFDITWYSFARMVSDVAPPADTDPNYMYSQETILTCIACGRYFVRHSSHQRYCDNPNCQAERNNRKARAYYKRKKASEEQ